MPLARERRAQTRIALALVVFLLTLGLADLSAWAFMRRKQDVTSRPRDGLAYRLRPGFSEGIDLGKYFPEYWRPGFEVGVFSVCPDGFRAPCVPERKEPGEFRVACMGDSITMGLGVGDSDHYPAQLERALARAVPGLRVRVMNAGIIGYSSRQGLLLYRQRVARYQPDLVVWAYGFNDAAGIPLFARMDAALIPLDPSRSAPALTRLKYQLFRRPIFQVIFSGFYVNFARIRMGQLMANLETLNRPGGAATRSESFRDSRVPPADFAEGLMELERTARADGFRLVCLKPNRIAPPYAKIIRAVCQERNIPFLDLESSFNAAIGSGDLPAAYQADYAPYRDHLQPGAAGNQTLVLTVDGLHPNAVGCRIIADELTRLIVRRWFPAAVPPPSVPPR